MHSAANQWTLTWHTRTKLVGELGYQVVIDAILQRAQDDHGTGVVYRKALHRLIRQDVLVGRYEIGGSRVNRRG